MIRLTLNLSELKFEVTVELNGLNPHQIPNPTQIKHRMVPSPSVLTSSQFTSTDEYPFDHKWGRLIFYNPISGLKDKTSF